MIASVAFKIAVLIAGSKIPYTTKIKLPIRLNILITTAPLIVVELIHIEININAVEIIPINSIEIIFINNYSKNQNFI